MLAAPADHSLQAKLVPIFNYMAEIDISNGLGILAFEYTLLLIDAAAENESIKPAGDAIVIKELDRTFQKIHAFRDIIADFFVKLSPQQHMDLITPIQNDLGLLKAFANKTQQQRITWCNAIYKAPSPNITTTSYLNRVAAIESYLEKLLQIRAFDL